MASGGLSRAGTTSLTRSITSMFRRNIPFNMDVWIDDRDSWLWVERAKNSRVIVRAGFLNETSDINQWTTFVNKEFSGVKLLWRIWGEKDSLVNLVEALEAIPIAIVLRASIAGLDTPAGASDIWLRSMGAGEFAAFSTAAADERGAVMAASGECLSIEEGRREALSEIKGTLSDGVASPGHYLYSLCHEGRTVGGVWMENDGGMAVVHSVVLDSKERRQGHRRAAIGALAAAAHGQGARQIQITVLPSDYNFFDALLSVGMDIISVDYVHEPTDALIR